MRTLQIDAGNVEGMQRQGSMSPWSAYGVHGEVIGRRSGTWEQMDEPERWRKRVKDPNGDYDLDLVETFFANLDLR